MAILNHGSTLRTADGGQTTTTIVTAANIGTYGVATNSTYYVGTTQNVFNRASGAQTLTGVSIDGNAATVTNGLTTGNYVSYSAFTSSLTSTVDARAPIFYDSNNTAYYLDPASTSNLNALTVAGGNATIYRDLIVNGGGSGNFGNRIIVQGTATTYTYQDTTLRPTVYLNGAYPVLTLNATESTNTLHGPTLQFAFNGLTTGGATSRQIVIGAPGTGSWLDFGFSGGANGDNSSYNPHNGIGGYNGVTAMRLFSNGLLVGSTGVYPNAVTSTSFALDVRGTGSSNTDFRAPIFYDSNNTAYYIDGASGSKLKYLQIDGDWASSPFGGGQESFTIRSTYASMCQRQTNGALAYWLHHIAGDGAYNLYGGRGATDGSSWDWAYRAYPSQDGNYVEFNTSARAQIFYDRNDTAYYLDPANSGTSLLVAGKVGIGTVSPIGLLEVRGANRLISNDGLLQVNSNNNAGIDLGGSISFGGVYASASVTEWAQLSGRKETATSGEYGGYLDFATRPHLGLNTSRIRITSTGNVGIGTTSPAYKLDVNGTTRFGGIVYNEAVKIDDFNYFNLQPYVESETLSTILSVSGTTPIFTTLTNTAAPFSKVLSVSAYGEAAMSDFIPVQAGETIYGEIWAYRATGAAGTAGVLYCGVQRYDKDKKMIDGNAGLNTSPSGYFIASNQTIPSNSTWTKYSGTLVLPTSHTPYNGSDGGPVRYIRPYIIYNYTGGTILTYIGGWKIRKTELTRDSGIVTINGNLSTARIGNINVGSGTYLNTITPVGDTNINLSSPSGAFYFDTFPRMPGFYDSNDTNYYVDPASTSILNATRHNSIVAGSTSGMSSAGAIAVYSGASPYISFHDGTTARTAYFQEAGGRFYFGEVTYTESEGSFRAPLFYDSNNTAYYIDPASTSNLLGLTVTNTITGSVSGNAVTAGGLAVHSGTNNEVNKIVRTDVNGYILAGWINTISGDNGTTAIDRVYASSDGYIRYYTPTNFRTVLDVPTRAGSGANGSWGISVTGSSASCTGNAATATTAAACTGNSATVTNGVYTNTSNTFGNTYANYFTSNLGTTSGSLSSPSLQAYATGANSAFMSFHRAANFAVNFGLDSDNVLRIGGWSAAANRLQLDMSGNLTLAGVVDATQFRDSSDTTYFVDPAGTSNLNKFSAFTMSYNDMNSMHIQSPYVTRYNASALYRNGTMGWGNVDCNVIFSNWGSGFIDSWGTPANGPGSSSHYVGFQSLHYNHQNNANGYGFQMLCAGEATNRFFWRSAWATLNSWVEMIHTGNYNSYAPTLTGTGASGTWSINVTGNAGGSSASCTGNAATVTNGVYTTGDQTIGGTKTFSSNIIVNSVSIGKGTNSISTNTAIGVSALSSNTTGNGRNCVVGYLAASNNTTGRDNSVFGAYALQSNTAGRENCAFGKDALRSNTEGYRNNAFGKESLELNTFGAYNNAFGYRSLYSNTTGSKNCAFGDYSLVNSTFGNRNVSIGFKAMQMNTTGSSNNAFGYQTLNSNTTGTNNNAFGSEALRSNTIGTANSAFGHLALTSNIITSKNSAFGYKSLQNHVGAEAQQGPPIGEFNSAFGVFSLTNSTSGEKNCAFGYKSLYQNNSGINNSAFGYTSLENNTTGFSNSAFGNRALWLNTGGAQNCAFGGSALNANTFGQYNNAFGSAALLFNQIGNNNNAVGYLALRTNTTSNNNAFGYKALYGNTTGIRNSAFGHNALNNNTIGTANTAFGYSAGSAITTGTNLTVIGYNAAASSATATNEVTLGNSSVATLRCQVTTITALSDIRDKQDIENIDLGLSFIEKLRPVKFKWDKREWYANGIRDGSKKSTDFEAGFIAQELKKLQEDEGVQFLKLVYQSNPEKLEATPGNLLVPLIKAVQELSQKVKILENRVSILENK